MSDVRLIAAEEELAHQAVTIETLSETVARQWDEIDQLKKRVDALTKRLLQLEEDAGSDIRSTRPPHY